ncbi:MAG: TldD/PmbA family protein [Thermoprotei archaeon]
MSKPMDPQELAQSAIKWATAAGSPQSCVTFTEEDNFQVRFANSQITLYNVNKVRGFSVYLAKRRKRIVGATTNPTPDSLKAFVERLARVCDSSPPGQDYVAFPEIKYTYRKNPNNDPHIESEDLVGLAEAAIDESIRAGAQRVAGSLNAQRVKLFFYNSNGLQASDEYTKVLLNVRAFAGENASGHGLSCASFISDFHPEEAGRTAGEYAKSSVNPSVPAEGVYRVLMSPTVVANTLPLVQNSSAYLIQHGRSFLDTGSIGRVMGPSMLSVEDHGFIEHGVGGRVFDDEGTPTRGKAVFSKGVFQTMIHNLTTSRKFSTISTGNAGVVNPVAYTVQFGAGNSSFDEMVKETKQGILVTNNWYTRYQNTRTGEYSTMPRDAAYMIVDGKIAQPIAGFRLSDAVPRQVSAVKMASKERKWIEWWEVHTPTFAPWMLVDGMRVTVAFGAENKA